MVSGWYHKQQPLGKECLFAFMNVKEFDSTLVETIVDLSNGECINRVHLKDLHYGPEINGKSFGMLMDGSTCRKSLA